MFEVRIVKRRAHDVISWWCPWAQDILLLCSTDSAYNILSLFVSSTGVSEACRAKNPSVCSLSPVIPTFYWLPRHRFTLVSESHFLAKKCRVEKKHCFCIPTTRIRALSLSRL